MTAHIENMPEAEYHAHAAVSSTALRAMLRSPAHYRACVDGVGRKETDAMRFGSMFHCLALEPERFDDAYGVLPEGTNLRTKCGKGRRTALIRRKGPGVIIAKAEEAAKARAMSDAVMAHPYAAQAVKDAPEVERSTFWTDEETGLECRTRVDAAQGSGKSWALVDLKTTQDASPDGFARSVAKYGYHIQAAHYVEGARALERDVTGFIFVVVEKEPPFAVGVYMLDEDAMKQGRMERREALQKIAECAEAKAWPSYNQTIQTISLPRWAQKDAA